MNNYLKIRFVDSSKKQNKSVLSAEDQFKTDYKKLVEELNDIRLGMDMSVGTWSRKSGVHENTIYRFIKGNNLYLNSIVLLAKALGKRVRITIE